MWLSVSCVFILLSEIGIIMSFTALCHTIRQPTAVVVVCRSCPWRVQARSFQLRMLKASIRLYVGQKPPLCKWQTHVLQNMPTHLM